ncbi:multicopper oxidase family protein [Thiomonas delicata]|uniref:Multicopper oxidase CueO n=1 Tax=Thiomonas delicata TaxID=364030 RepID=A0A238D339_THIDL|nr:multicopper oxidase domain-containing protein [Thiomonas delicata]SBP87659.1 Blue copper oxidase CueO [Thiomonas delicata]
MPDTRRPDADETSPSRTAATPALPIPTRRQMLGAAAAGGALWMAGRAHAQGMAGMPMGPMSGGMAGMPGMGAAPAHAPRPARFERPLVIPAQLQGQPRADGSLGYALRMSAGHSELLAGVRTPTWGYNGAYLGPALRVPRGKQVRIAVRNDLNQATTTHWHGAHVPGRMDGGPQSLIAPGQSLVYDFALDQPGATLWYHPHPDGLTGAHVYAGLAGMLLVDDGVDRALDLPRTWGVDDIALILQDRRMDAGGRLLYMPSMMDRMGMKGNRFLVNGREQPYVQVPAQWVRLRVLNGSNARVYNLAFAEGQSFHVIAGDAGLLARPVEMRSLLLAPAERAEILLDLRRLQGKALVLRSDSGSVVPGLSSMPMDADIFDHQGFDLLQLRVGAPLARSARLPAKLVSIPALRPDAPVRHFSLQGMMGSMMAGGMQAMGGMAGAARASANAGPGGMSLGIGMQHLFSINHQFMDMAVINQRVRLGSTEVWEVSNDAEMAHPFHLHGTSFQILDRDGSVPPEHERGWKDVVFVRRNETVRLAARFDQPAGRAHPFMYHCHILEHEDNGMMGQFTVA